MIILSFIYLIGEWAVSAERNTSTINFKSSSKICRPKIPHCNVIFGIFVPKINCIYSSAFAKIRSTSLEFTIQSDWREEKCMLLFWKMLIYIFAALDITRSRVLRFPVLTYIIKFRKSIDIFLQKFTFCYPRVCVNHHFIDQNLCVKTRLTVYKNFSSLFFVMQIPANRHLIAPMTVLD